jgi:hypothetical protein
MGSTAKPKKDEALKIVREKEWQTDFKRLMQLTKFIIGPADTVARLTGVEKRDTIYGWAAGRCSPAPEQDRYLRSVAALVTLVFDECSITPEQTRHYLHSFNYSQSGVEETRLERLSAGETVAVFEETVQHFAQKQIP